MSAEISHSVEQALNADGNNLRNNEEIVNYLNNLCTTLANAKELFNQTGFYDAVCKRVAKYVLSEVSSIRAVTYRILRKASQLPDDLSVLLNMHMDSFAIRSLELDANNSEERIEALKLCTMMLSHMNEKTKSSESGMVKKDYSNAVFPENICRALISIANCFFVIGSDRTKVEKKRDELAFSCFAVIIEQAVIAPGLILNSVDAGWIVEFFTNAIFNDHLSNLVCQILCAWLDSPQLRTQAKLRLVLNRIFASVIEIELFEQKGPIELERLSNDSLLKNFSQIFLNLLRTWAGLFSCLTLGDQKLSIISPLSFLDYMGLNRSMHANNRKIRDLIIECCCEVLELPYSKTRFTNWLHTTYYYSTMFYPDAYKSSLRNEFILSEHEIYLKIVEQHSSVNDLLVSFRSVVAYLLINSNLIQTLSRIILRDPDDPVALRATLLMHDVLLASSTCLPMEWRLRILSLPTLIHNAYEVVSGTHISKKHPLNDDDYKLHKLIFTYAEQRNVIVLLNRLDILNSIALAQKTQPLPITNLQLFVQSSSTAIKLRKSKLSAVDFNHQEGDIDNVERALERLLFKAVESDGKLCWPVVDKLFQLLQSYYSCKDVPIKYSKKCYIIFRLIFNFMTPAESSLIKFDDNRFIITCCCRAIHVSLLFAPREIQYKELLANFINDFIANISSDALLSGPLSLKNLVNTGAIYYFAFIGAVSAIKEGRKMLEATPLLDFSTKSLNSKDNISIKSKICRNVAM
ncbi:Rapamycin-insensitive companion of mTOR [Dirofilaria immitis]